MNNRDYFLKRPVQWQLYVKELNRFIYAWGGQEYASVQEANEEALNITCKGSFNLFNFQTYRYRILNAGMVTVLMQNKVNWLDRFISYVVGY